MVATPIGNVEDMSPRARHVLETVDLIAAEDTRRARSLFARLGIEVEARLVSYYDQVEERRTKRLIGELLDGRDIALISDAGTPAIADPGYRLIRAAHRQALGVVPVVGASAVMALASASGLPTDQFFFEGFLPTKAGARAQAIDRWSVFPASCGVFCFESALRLSVSFEAIANRWPFAEIAVGREMTKIHEEIRVGQVSELMGWMRDHRSLKGEVTMMVSRGDDPLAKKAQDELEDLARQALLRGEKPREILKKLGRSLTRKTLYGMMAKLSRGEEP